MIRARRSIYRAFNTPDTPIAVDQDITVLTRLTRNRVLITYPSIHPSTLIVPRDMLEDHEGNPI
jgi:hypothetical protein